MNDITRSRQLVPQTYRRGVAILTINSLAPDKEQGQVQLQQLSCLVPPTDHEVMLAIIIKLDPGVGKSFDLLIDFATIVEKYDQTVAGAALNRFNSLYGWRERKRVFQKIVSNRLVQDEVWMRAAQNLQSLSRVIDLSDLGPQHKSKR